MQKPKSISTGLPEVARPQIQTSPQGYKVMRVNVDDSAVVAEWPSVSLCMIVKNEEDNLAAAIESAEDLPTEVIVVDTGSTDDTVEVAKRVVGKGKGIVAFWEWMDDFAAARNGSINLATSDWIFWIDGDDRLNPKSIRQIKNILASNIADAYVLGVKSVVSRTGQDTQTILKSPHVRIFRNVGAQFINPVHEDIAPSLKDLGLVFAETDIEIEHIGYHTSLGAMVQRSHRNLRILERELVKDQRNMALRYHRAVNLYVIGDWDMTVPELEAVIKHPPATMRADSEIYMCYPMLATAYIHMNMLDKAKEVIDRGLGKYPDHRHMLITAGMFYLTVKNPAQALTYLEKAQSFPETTNNARVSWPEGHLENLLTEARSLVGGNIPMEFTLGVDQWPQSIAVGL